MATKSAKSSISIFSSWVAAPYSEVITYAATSEKSTTCVSPCPIPAVSRKMRSKPAAFNTSRASSMDAASSVLDSLVANERMKACGVSTAFIRMRSPRRAPPVLRFEGSTERMAIVISGRSLSARRTISSVRDDFPEPPVPVMPTMGTLRSPIFLVSSARKAAKCPSSVVL